MTIFGGSSEDERGDRYGTEESIDWEEVLLREEDVLFSCSSPEKDEDRELYLTRNRLVVRYKEEGASFAVENADVSFGRHGDFFRLTVTNGSTGYGLRVSEDDFEEFWMWFSSLMD